MADSPSLKSLMGLTLHEPPSRREDLLFCAPGRSGWLGDSWWCQNKMKLEAMAISSLVSGGLAAVVAIAGALGLGLAAIASRSKMDQHSSTRSKPLKKNGGYRRQNMKQSGGIRKGFMNGVREWFGKGEPDQITGNRYEYDDDSPEYSDYHEGNNIRRNGAVYPVNYKIERHNSKRKKRFIAKTNHLDDQQAAEEWNLAKMKQDQMMEVVRAQDASKCGLKLVCELASLNDEQLTYDHLAMLDLVGPSINPDNVLLPPEENLDNLDARSQYRLARGVGANGYSCVKYYPSCPIEDIVAVVDQILP
ncbi:hypothetical protein FHG87_009823 [Trinorchestia longiramus]|nr:hypothetical protein FHG87_009823 [Trinorchestia longiramus]